MPNINLKAASEGVQGRLSRNDAATYLGFAPKTLAEWQRLGMGPPSHKVGGRRFYRVVDLNAYIRGEAS
ncbi:helix-turn-helix transcriptional regulator [Rhizorhapis sp. SPR117]|uniref:helix-turn-helix transcriptional regulator n=1 Tax=Rhizorhapis sp. SPR117 TaxID=2912611 RepID=UPI0030C84414